MAAALNNFALGLNLSGRATRAKKRKGERVQTSFPPLPLRNGALWVSGTFLDTYMECPRKAEYYKLWGRVSSSPSSALTFGSHLHSALALHFRQQEFAPSPTELRNKVATLLEGEFARQPVEEDDWRNLNWALTIYDQFAKKFAREEFELLQYDEPQRCGHCIADSAVNPGLPVVSWNEAQVADLKVVALQSRCLWCNGTGQHRIMSEVPFALPLVQVGELPVVFHGFIDLPILWRGQPWVLDFKSTAMLGDLFWADKAMSSQQKGYAWAWQEIAGQRVGGYLVRAIRTSSPPKNVVEQKPKRDGSAPKTVEDWWHETLGEHRFYLNEGELDEWKQNAIATVREFLYHYGNGYFPRRTTACAPKWKCPYFDVCSVFPPASRATMLNSGLFKNKESVRVK